MPKHRGVYRAPPWVSSLRTSGAATTQRAAGGAAPPPLGRPQGAAPAAQPLAAAAAAALHGWARTSSRHARLSTQPMRQPCRCLAADTRLQPTDTRQPSPAQPSPTWPCRHQPHAYPCAQQHDAHQPRPCACRCRAAACSAGQRGRGAVETAATAGVGLCNSANQSQGLSCNPPSQHVRPQQGSSACAPSAVAAAIHEKVPSMNKSCTAGDRRAERTCEMR